MVHPDRNILIIDGAALNRFAFWMRVPKNHHGQPSARKDDMKHMEAGSGRDLAIEMPVVRLLEIEEGFGGDPHAGRSTTTSIRHPRRACVSD
jgi:hypothetical protein